MFHQWNNIYADVSLFVQQIDKFLSLGFQNKGWKSAV